MGQNIPLWIKCFIRGGEQSLKKFIRNSCRLVRWASGCFSCRAWLTIFSFENGKSLYDRYQADKTTLQTVPVPDQPNVPGDDVENPGNSADRSKTQAPKTYIGQILQRRYPADRSIQLVKMVRIEVHAFGKGVKGEM